MRPKVRHIRTASRPMTQERLMLFTVQAPKLRPPPWFILPSGPGNGGLGQPNKNGQVLIFQGSFIKDGIAQGIAGVMLIAFTSNGQTGVQAYVSFDHQIPASGVLPLLGLAGLMGTRRRRG